ncbi:tetratricopeptide repeat protein [Desulfofustis limnaeus]|jgi:TolA-binding protein|uniref:Cell division coordinator CpoB n=1 Tax=Desulfofustis limnaeus TaxID=2740163 RepID=A0ABN6M2X9_9BACT|nr:tetratricopeptide repeat protein [Desulfofustis limnaeus]MDX9894379.1 tetratricopeptide repeat protein [Desulfofustis sp.]BDD87262.1 hypothetical protein DPPLL_16270 [Desulfofustis limnaeus]
MKKIPLTLLCAFIASPFLMQCASQNDLNQIHYQLRMLNKKVSDLESVTIDDLQKRQALSVSQIDRLEQDLLAMRSGLEETGHLNRRLNEQSKELEAAFRTYTQQEEEKRLTEMQRLQQEISQKDQQLDKLAEQIKMQQENLQAIQQARVDEAKRKAAAAAQAAEEARQRASSTATGTAGVMAIEASKAKKLVTGSEAQAAVQNEPAPETQAAPPAAVEQAPAPVPSGTIARGKSLYEQGKFREAYALFEGLAKSANAQEAVEARYMMGECLFALKEYDQAILDYQTIITNYPSSAKAPTAMMQQALAFERLNDKDTAKILYKKLIASYKDSPEAAQAQQKLGAQ